MSNFLDGVFTPRYTWSSVTGFETRLDTSLAGNTTIGDSTTNYSLLLNGLPIVAGGGGGGVASVSAGTNIYIANPAIPVVNVSVSTTLDLHNNDLSGIISFNGVGAKFNSNSNLIAIGNGAASGNTGSYVNAFGCNAGQSNTGSNVNAIGYNAAYSNQGANVNAIGSNTAESNVGWFVNAIGNLAASNNTSDHVNAFGTAAASGNSGGNVNAIGNNAATNNTGSYVNAFGCNAGIGNTGNNCTFIGKNQYLSVNNLSDRLIVYSSSNNPLLYGDTSNMSLGIGTTTLSAALTVSGKICATGILDTVNSTGTANQVLTAGTGGGSLVWASSSVGGVASVTAGTGISVGGTITNPSVAIADIGSSGIYAYPSSVTTNSQGQVTAITAGSNYPYIWQFSVDTTSTIALNGYVINYVPVYSNNSNPMTNTGTTQTIPITGFYQINFVPIITGNPTTGTPPIWQLTMNSNVTQFATSTFVGAFGEYYGIAPPMTGCGYLTAGTNVNVEYVGTNSPGGLNCSAGTSITYILLSPLPSV